jgi:hypothetical protein
VSCYRIVLAEKARTPVSVACELLGVSASGFYAWASRAPSDRELSDAWLIECIKQIHADHREVYGSRRVTADRECPNPHKKNAICGYHSTADRSLELAELQGLRCC